MVNLRKGEATLLAYKSYHVQLMTFRDEVQVYHKKVNEHHVQQMKKTYKS